MARLVGRCTSQPDISTLPGSGHFYFALTLSHPPIDTNGTL